MKKKMFGIGLALALSLGLLSGAAVPGEESFLPAAVAAEAGTVITVTEDKDFDGAPSEGSLETDGYHWDAESKTLTLSQVRFEGMVIVPADAVIVTQAPAGGEGSYVEQLEFGMVGEFAPVFRGTAPLVINQRIECTAFDGTLTVDTGAVVSLNGGISMGSYRTDSGKMLVRGSLLARGAADAAIDCGTLTITGTGGLTVKDNRGVRVLGSSGTATGAFSMPEEGGYFQGECKDYNLMVYFGTSTDSCVRDWISLDPSHASEDWSTGSFSATDKSGSPHYFGVCAPAGARPVLQNPPSGLSTPPPMSQTCYFTGAGGTLKMGTPPPAPTVPSSGGGHSWYYDVVVDHTIQRGTVTPSVKQAAARQTITLTLTPDPGFMLDRFTLVDRLDQPVEWKEGPGEQQVTFRMPVGGVWADADFYCKGDETCPSRSLTDVPLRAWFHGAVDHVLRTGVMEPMTPEAFRPDGPMTRAMAVSALYRMAGSPAAEGQIAFPDVPETAAYAPAVGWAVSEGIVLGRDDGTFDPEGTVTREELILLFHRYAGSPEPEGELHAYDDVRLIHPYAHKAVTWAAENGIVGGVRFNEMAPHRTSTRAQAAAMLERFMLR